MYYNLIRISPKLITKVPHDNMSSLVRAKTWRGKASSFDRRVNVKTSVWQIPICISPCGGLSKFSTQYTYVPRCVDTRSVCLGFTYVYFVPRWHYVITRGHKYQHQHFSLMFKLHIFFENHHKNLWKIMQWMGDCRIYVVKVGIVLRFEGFPYWADMIPLMFPWE